jgi:signal transduction histidine kinase
MMSLRKRLNVGLVSILCVVFVIHWLAADWVIRSVAEKQMATRLREDGESIFETMTLDSNGQLNLNSVYIASVYNHKISGHYYSIQFNNQRYDSNSLHHRPITIKAPLPEPGQLQLYHLSKGPEQLPILALVQVVEKFGYLVTITTAEELSSVDHDITFIRLSYFGLSLTVLICAIVLQSIDVRRSLKPIVNVRQELEQVTKGYQQQIDVAVPSEIKPLVKEINRLLALVVRRLQQSRTAIGNLAHALKPPLALLFKVAEHPIFNDHPELKQLLQTQTDAMHRSIERELKRARIAGNQQASIAFNPYLELMTLAKLLKTIYAEKQLVINVIAPDVLVHFDREDMLEMIGNLLDNACKWAKHDINVEIIFSQTLTIAIADDGPGCDALNAQVLTQRGLRLDESIQGHGLGLAIVLDIVNCYEGVLEIGRSKILGGVLATVYLPLNVEVKGKQIKKKPD